VSLGVVYNRMRGGGEMEIEREMKGEERKSYIDKEREYY
jgi:hypothetical protein